MALAATAALLCGCQFSVKDSQEVTGNATAPEGSAERAAVAAAAPDASLVFADAAADPALPPDVPRPVMQLQVVLDRLGFSPGVIDGKQGSGLKLALRSFQLAHDLPESGTLDDATKAALEPSMSTAATRLVTIPAAFAQGPFVPDLPKDAAEQAKLPALGYRDLMEALAERFHTTRETLIALNSPTTKVGAGRVIRVPDIPDVDASTLPADERGWNATLQTLGVSPQQPVADTVVVDRSEGVLRVLDDKGAVIASFPATMGSEHDPLPIGTWKIQGVSRNPDFHYNPKLFWDVNDSKEAQLLKPGPNGPVGVVWLDLSKPHYGIHGTGEPQTIGRAESHGCVRLTNWDAARLAQMVKPGTPAIFQE